MGAKSFAVVAISALAAATTPVVAQHTDHSAHHGAGPAALVPTEQGDAAFAAIAEIVALLIADPDTDWGRVDIEALRNHLVDMNRLVMEARVRSERLGNGLRMRIQTNGPGGEAAGRMVPVHGPVLAAETGWSSEVLVEGDEIEWTVTGDGEDAALRIAALGFFGLMATGDHHRAHHLALARGEAMH